MDAKNYILERLNQYQSWYDAKATESKRKYLRMRSFSVIGGGLVPVLINIPQQTIYGIPIIQIAVTIISLLVVVFVSLESVYHYREQWKNYRSTEQLLGHEKFMFQTKVGKYSGLSEEDSYRLFVKRVEDAIFSENAATLNIMTTAGESSVKISSSQSPKL